MCPRPQLKWPKDQAQVKGAILTCIILQVSHNDLSNMKDYSSYPPGNVLIPIFLEPLTQPQICRDSRVKGALKSTEALKLDIQVATVNHRHTEGRLSAIRLSRFSRKVRRQICVCEIF